MNENTERVQCKGCGGSWSSPTASHIDLLRKVRELRDAGQTILGIKELRGGLGLDFADAKAVVHHFADATCTCHRCHAPLDGEPLTICFYCKSFNYDTCGTEPARHRPGTDREGRSVADRVREVFGDHAAAERHDAWNSATATLTEGAMVEGRVVLVYHFGVFVDIGIGFPALLEVIEFDHRSRRREEKPPWPRVGEVVRVRIAHISPAGHVIRVSQRHDSRRLGSPRVDEPGLPHDG